MYRLCRQGVMPASKFVASAAFHDALLFHSSMEPHAHTALLSHNPTSAARTPCHATWQSAAWNTSTPPHVSGNPARAHPSLLSSPPYPPRQIE